MASSSLSTLLDEHASSIAELRDLVGDAVPADEVTADGVSVDDVFLLRFVLSNRKKKTLESAAEKVRDTLRWRRENAELLTAMAQGEPHPLEKGMSDFLFSGLGGSLAGGEPLSVVRMGSSNFRALMKTYDVETVATFLLFEKEKMFRICDRETRARDELVKAVTVIDFAGFTMFGGRFDQRFFKSLGASSEMSGVFFPQLQLKTVAINTPTYYGMIQKTLSAVMPKSSMEKFAACPAKKTDTKSCSECPFMSANGGEEAVPPFLGGTAAVPRSLVPPGERAGEIPMSTIKVAARSYATVGLAIEQKDTIVEFEVMVDSFHVLMQAEVVPFTDATRPLPALGTVYNGGSSVYEVDNADLADEAGGDDDDDGGDFDEDEDDGDGDGDGDDDEAGAAQRFQVEHYKVSKKKSKKKNKKKKGASKTNSLKRGFRRRRAKLVDDDEVAEVRLTDPRRYSLNPRMAQLRLDAKDGLKKGTWKIPTTGRLLLRFENGFSRVRSKKVTFRISTVPPPQDEEERAWWETNWAEYGVNVKWPSSSDEEWNCTIS